MKSHVLIIIATILAVLVLFVLIELLIVKYNGESVKAPSIPRQPQSLGSGPDLTYVVMGDSTAIGQGADYKDGYAVAGANHLAGKYQVKFVNTGVSGARTKDVLENQLSKAASYKPDVVVLAVGANDATHFTNGKSIQTSLQAIIDGLKESNCDVRIVVTRSPAVDTAPRFPWPLNNLMYLRTKQVNAAFEPVIKQNNLTLAPVAEKTRKRFLNDPTLLAPDKFHPNAKGYSYWKPVINQALDEALQKPTPTDCPKTTA